MTEIFIFVYSLTLKPRHAVGVTNVNPKVSPEDKNYNRPQKINPGDTCDKYDTLHILLDLHR